MVRREQIWAIEPESEEVFLDRLWRFEVSKTKESLAAYRKAVAIVGNPRASSSERSDARARRNRYRVEGLARVTALTALMRKEFASA